MELNRQVLDDVKFETKGRWYNADQVDEFLEELAESVEQAQAEVARLRQEVRGLKGEIRTVRAEKSQLEHGRDEGLEQEQARLLEDVKALKQFREQFRRAIEQDARQLLDQARTLGSDRLL